jgi:hypothetical protein
MNKLYQYCSTWAAIFRIWALICIVPVLVHTHGKLYYEDFILIGIVTSEMTGNDRTWPDMTGHDRIWPVMTGYDRTWLNVTWCDRTWTWPNMTGNDRAVFYARSETVQNDRAVLYARSETVQNDREKKLFYFSFFRKKQKSWSSFQAKIRPSCKLHENQSKKKWLSALMG